MNRTGITECWDSGALGRQTDTPAELHHSTIPVFQPLLGVTL
jgi:hypothetical protein